MVPLAGHQAMQCNNKLSNIARYILLQQVYLLIKLTFNHEAEPSMHVEIPKSRFASFREFAGEYAMIVVSIAAALALEHGVQRWHQAHLAEDAMRRMDKELRANLAEVEKVGKYNADHFKDIEKLRASVLKDMRANAPDDAIRKHFNTLSKGDFGFSIQTPTLSRDAWDVAVANQSASWLDAATLQRYSGAYAAIRDLQSSNNLGLMFVNGPELVRRFSEIELGTITARDLYLTLQQAEASYQATNDNLRTLKKELNKALAGQAPG